MTLESAHGPFTVRTTICSPNGKRTMSAFKRHVVQNDTCPNLKVHLSQRILLTTAMFTLTGPKW